MRGTLLCLRLLDEFAHIERSRSPAFDSLLNSRPQRLELCPALFLALLDEPQAVPHHFARTCIAPAVDKLAHQRLVALSNGVARWHGSTVCSLHYHFMIAQNHRL